MKKPLVIFAVIVFVIIAGMVVFSWMFAWLEQPHGEEFTPAEIAVRDKYDSTYAGAFFDINQPHNGSRLYYVYFDSRSDNIDFAKVSEDSLRQTVDALYRDLAPVIPDRDSYDSLLVVFNTQYPSKPPNERRLSDTAFKPYSYIVRYSLR